MSHVHIYIKFLSVRCKTTRNPPVLSMASGHDPNTLSFTAFHRVTTCSKQTLDSLQCHSSYLVNW